MTSLLIDRLITEYDYPEISLDNHDAFVAQPGLNVLFFPGDPETVKDATDVAVILPELVAALENRLNPGVVVDTFGAGMKLKRQYGFTHYPSLVFIRDGEYVGTITRIQDWVDYLSQINAMFTAPVRRAPGFSIPVVSA
jgi:hydrogenase-1 operon protein HyaE